ncbi:MAG: pentapeptide repeat-containing protein [Cyanobacteria bacterium J06639_1]
MISVSDTSCPLDLGAIASLYASGHRDFSQLDGVGGNLEHKLLARAVLVKANLRGADLRNTTFIRADLSGACLRQALMHHAILDEAILWKADLSQAHLRGTSFRRAILAGADLRSKHLWRSQLEGAYYDANTLFPQGFDPLAAGMLAIASDWMP